MNFASSAEEAAAWWRGRRVVVTGASGFIGRHLVRALGGKGAEVHSFVRKPQMSGLDPLSRSVQHHWDLGRSDGSSLRLLETIKPDIVFHGAVHRSDGSSSVEPSGRDGLNQAFKLTTEGGARFAQACASAGVKRFILLGSSSEYGPHDEALHEALQDRPVSVHARSKAALTAAVKSLTADGLNAIILRIFYAYGSGDDPRRFIPTICRAALSGNKVRLTPRGFVRDYIHVDDVITACLRAGALQLCAGELINVGTGVETDNHDIVEIVQSMCGGRPGIESVDFEPRPADAGHWRADTRRMRERLGILDTIGIEEGLRQLLASERERAAQIDAR